MEISIKKLGKQFAWDLLEGKIRDSLGHKREERTINKESLTLSI